MSTRSRTTVAIPCVVVSLAVLLCAVVAGGDDRFSGTWKAMIGSGGLIIAKSGGDYTVVIVDEYGNRSTAETAKLSDGKLDVSFKAGELPIPQGPDLIRTVGRLTISAGATDDRLKAELVQATGTQTMELEKVDNVSAIATATSQPAPDESTPPGFTPPPTPEALIEDNFASDKDRQVAENTYALQVAIEKFAAAHGKLPTAYDVSLVRGVSNFLDPWPANPYTAAGGPMLAGDKPGEFVYSSDGTTYAVSGHLGDGSDFTVKGPAD